MMSLPVLSALQGNRDSALADQLIMIQSTSLRRTSEAAALAETAFHLSNKQCMRLAGTFNAAALAE